MGIVSQVSWCGSIRHLPTIVLTALAMMAVGCATVLDEDGALAIAPYKIEPNGQIVIEVYVNGQGPLDFAIDTAASISVLTDKTSETLGIEAIPGQEVAIQGILASGRFPLLDIDRLAVGQEIVPNPRIAELSGDTDTFSDIDGIFGADLLKRYAVGFSKDERVIRLYPRELVSARTYSGWRAIRLRPEYFSSSGAAIYVFDVEIRGQRIPALLDLGAGFNLMSMVTARKLDYRPRRPARNQEMSGAIESTPEVSRLRVRKLSAGAVYWEDVDFSVLEVALFDTFNIGFSPRIILGSGMFTQQDFIIDFERNRLLVKTSKR